MAEDWEEDDDDEVNPYGPDETGTDEDAALGEIPGEPKASRGWLKLITDAETAFRTYQLKADNIDKLFANLERLGNTARDREIQLFWANISVMGPSVYARPPVPVVVPKWKQREELITTTCEILERATIDTFDKENVDGVMRLIRDDLIILARGVPWLRLETKKGVERVCIDHADRKDWLCEPARNWKEVDWVAKRSWLTRPEARKRFKRFSKDAYKELHYSVRKDAESDADDGTAKAGIWEIWCKSEDKVVWVSEGATVCLDEGPPHLTLEDFFPCPKPAFGTLQRRSLVPIPDYLFYKDQLEEINEVTDRISALTEALRVRGFYPAGAGDIGDAIETAFKQNSNNTIMVPVSNWAAIGSGGIKDSIVWLPIEVISATITAIIAIRKELINDVYEVTGLSDIMRGQTEASETLGAQQLKSQYGSVRVRDRQDELTRVARDVTRITAEIIAENFSGKQLMEMAQMPLPSDADIEEKAAPLKATLEKVQKELPALEAHLQAMQQQLQEASQDPEVHQMAAKNPQQAQAVLGQVQQQMQEGQQQVQQLQQAGQQAQQQLQALQATVTIDKVLKLLREQKLRPFILDIETDSTITPDENASKQRATEFVTAVGGYMKNAIPLVEGMPQSAPMVAETLKFITSQYRAGRELQGVIDKFADDMEAKAAAPPPPNPAAMEAQQKAQESQAAQAAAQAKAQADQQTAQAKLQLEASAQQFEQQQAAAQQQIDAQAAQDAHALAQQQLRLDGAVHAAKTAETDQKHALVAAESQQKHEVEWRKAELDSLTKIQVAEIGAKQALDALALTKQLEAEIGFKELAMKHEHEQNMAQQEQAHAVELAKQGHEAAAAAAKAKPTKESA